MLSTGRTASLGWELNLIETMSVNLIPPGSAPTHCRFSHLVVMDFEATCFDIPRDQYRHEIIEFPAVLMDMKTGSIVDEFHYYINPTENPVLSEFCRNLTGITQHQVNQGLKLNVCLKMFMTWMYKMKQKHRIQSFGLVTWSDWDFSVCLKDECFRKNIALPPIFNIWIDLKRICQEFTKSRKGLQKSCKWMGLKFEGTPHSGICDARNTAKLAWVLHMRGANIRITSCIRGRHFF